MEKTGGSGNGRLVSNNAETLAYRERRSLPRLTLSAELFRLSPGGKIFSVSDLSQSGMGFWLVDREDSSLFTLGLAIQGTLNLRREKYAVQARVRNLTGDRVGCEFENLSEEASIALKKFLDPALLGHDLKPLPAAERNSLWYHGPTGTDLVLRRSTDGQYKNMTLYVLSTYIQWDAQEGLSTGKVSAADEHCEVRGIHRLETLLMDSDAAPDPKKLTIAKTVLMSSNLPLDLKNWCVRQVDQPVR